MPMPTFVIPPLVKWTLGALGAARAVQWLVKEWRRVNEDLDRARTVPVDEGERANLPRLRRDPVTGVYRPYQ
jgi:hypothetical protein